MSRRPLVVISAAGLASAALSGVSLAYWTGLGSGGANASNATNLTGVALRSVTVGDIGSGSALIPGGSADVVVKVSNSNGFPVTVTSIAPTTGQPVTAANACTPTGVTFTGQAGSWVIPAGSAGTPIRLPGAAHMDTTSSSACQGTTFRIPVTVTARQ